MLVSLTRQLLLFGHLAAFAFALVTILREDLAMLTVRRVDPVKLARTARMTKWLLWFLWITGVILLGFAVGPHPAAVWANPKLAMKVAVVVLLTINGWVLHRFAFPMLTRPQAQPHVAAVVCATVGAISSVSWVYAALVGSARYVAPKMNLEEFVGIYLLALVAGILIAQLIVRPHVEKLLLPLKTTRGGQPDRRQGDRRMASRRHEDEDVRVPATGLPEASPAEQLVGSMTSSSQVVDPQQLLP